MSGTQMIVEQVVQARLIVSMPRSATLRVTLRYRSNDPLAVRMGFPAEYALDGDDGPAPNVGLESPPEVEWVFGRELLAAGLHSAVGLGDVRIRPGVGRQTVVELRAPEGTALLQFETAALRRFLFRSFLVIPEGSEFHHLDPDRALAQLLDN